MSPWQLYLGILAGWINHQQQLAIEYLRTENRILREQVGKRRILLSDDQRRKLAVKGKQLGYARLKEIGTLFTPDTILRWHRQLVARKYDSSERRNVAGRPRIRPVIVDSILRMADDNPTWGYQRIQGSLANLGFDICQSTIANVLREHGIEPAPDRIRSTRWRTFLKAHWEVLAAIDFTTVEVWTARGLVTFYLLFAIELTTRRVHLAGITTQPQGDWMKQMARNLTDCQNGFLVDKRYLVMDRDTKFTTAFRETLKTAKVQSIRLPPYSPNLNAFIERYFRSLKSECLNRMIFFGERSLRNAVTEYLSHYHLERNHQGMGNQLIEMNGDVITQTDDSTPIRCRERLGGMLRYYHRAA